MAEAPKGILDSCPGRSRIDAGARIPGTRRHVGFDWPDVAGVVAKLEEEWREVSEALSTAERENELGDLLFAMVNLVRWNHADAETLLRKASQRFKQRFAHIEQSARRQGRSLSSLSLEEMDELWKEAKGRGL
jgi:uncharacterized protein YabN with tetrapyrrole methylase and pyrophosphatase domain